MSAFTGLFTSAKNSPPPGEQAPNGSARASPEATASAPRGSPGAAQAYASEAQSQGKQASEADAEAEPSGEGDHHDAPKIKEITQQVLDKYMPAWNSKPHKHITFKHSDFYLESLEGLVRLSKTNVADLRAEPKPEAAQKKHHHDPTKIDLTQLESFDVSDNALREMNCIRGTYGFTSLRVLKARKNALVVFEVNLPSLKELDLSHNKLKDIPPTSGMPELEVFMLGHNLMNSTFAPLRSLNMLKKLDLSNNRFDCRPTELGQRLSVLENLPLLHSLRLKDNPFCRLLPEYQAFVLQRLPALTKFDDLENVREVRELASPNDFKKLDDYDALVFERGKADRTTKKKHEDFAGSKDQGAPTLGEMMDPISEALADLSPEMVIKSIKELIRICDKIHQLGPDQMASIFRDLKAQSQATQGGPGENEVIDSAINQFLGDFAVLHSRIDDDPAARVMLLRCLAKLGIVHIYDLGEKCMRWLGWLMKRSPEAESEVLSVVKEIVVEPLRFRTIQDKQMMPVVRGLAKFDSPNLPEALAPIAGWLAKMYCNYGASPQADVTRLLATATRTQGNTERALVFHSGDASGGGGGGSKQENLPAHVFLALSNKTLAQNESLREQFMGHLQIVRNTAKFGGNKVVEVYQDKQLHRELVKLCKTFFGDQYPIDMSKSYSKANPKRKEIQLDTLKILDIRTCAALLEALSALMDNNHDILLDLADAKPPQGVPVVEYFSIAPRAATVSDPVLLAASMKGIYLILDQYSHENAAARNEMISLIIKDLDKMNPMLEYINDKCTSKKYEKLWKKAEAHLANRAEGGSGKSRVETGQAPKLTALTNPLVHEAFEAIVMVIMYFTGHANDSKLCNSVSAAMNDGNREQLLFQLLQVPSVIVRTAVMKTLEKVDSSEMSSDEVGYLVTLLQEAKDLAREESLLQQVVLQLQKFAAEREGAGAGAALKNDHSNTSIEAVTSVLLRNSMRKSYSIPEEQDKTKLSKACVKYLKTVSKWPECRDTNLRSKNVCGCLIDILKFEDQLHTFQNEDIGAEGSWTGRSVETLLQCISGSERLNARGKVAYRVLCRIADCLEGKSDKPGEDEIEDRPSREMAAEEVKMWDEARMKRDLKALNDIERSDRATQQQVFAAFNGLDRVATFLLDLYGTAEKKQSVRRTEQAAQEKARDFLENSKTEAKQRAEKEAAANAQGDDGQLQLEDDRSDSDGDADQNVIIATYPGGVFPAAGNVELRGGKDGSASAGAFGNAISIAFTAMAFKPNSGMAIADIGNGSPSDNILVLCDVSDLVFQIYVGTDGDFSELRAPGAITTPDPAGKTRRFLLTISERGSMKIWMGEGQAEGNPIAEKENQHVPRVQKRRRYYVGCSHFPEYGHFEGNISDFKIWNGAMDWAALMEESAGGEKIDRKTVMRVMNRFDPNKPNPVKPELQMGSALGCNVPRELQIREEFADYEGRLNVAAPIAAMLRACFSLLKVPSGEQMRVAMETALKDQMMIGRLLMLVKMCGPFDFCVAAKFMRLMSLALTLPASATEESVDLIALYNLLADYCNSLCQTAVRAVQQQDSIVLEQRGCMLATDMARLASTIVRTVPFCSNGFNDGPAAQTIFHEICLERLMPLSVVKSLLQMAMDASKSVKEGAPPGDDKAKQEAEQLNQMWELLRLMLSTLLDKCPKLKYDIFMIFSTHIVNGAASLRQSFLTGVLAQIKQASDTKSIQQHVGDTAIEPPEPRLTIGKPLEGPERTVGFAKCEAFVQQPATASTNSGGNWLPVFNPLSPTPFLACVVTNKVFMIIDASVAGYPRNPKVIEKRDIRDLTRLVRGSGSQMLYVGLMSRNGGEEFIVLLCHRESDRTEMQGCLQALSIPPAGDSSMKVPVQTDQIFKKAVEMVSADAVTLMSFALAEAKGSEKRTLQLFVLSETQLHQFYVQFQFWTPAEQAEEAGSESEDEASDEEGGPKQKREEKHDKKDEGDQALAGMFGQKGDSKAKELLAQAEEIDKAREKARGKEKKVKDEDGIEKEPQDVLLDLVQSWQISQMEKVAFYPESTPKMALDFEGGSKVIIVFFDDVTRETWRRTLIATMQRPDQSGSKWVRSFGGKSNGRKA